MLENPITERITMTKMTKYQLEHFENKVNRYFQPLIDEQQLLIKQYRTQATNNVVKKLAKKMGADKILAKMKEAEEFMLQAQRDAKSFFIFFYSFGWVGPRRTSID